MVFKSIWRILAFDGSSFMEPKLSSEELRQAIRRGALPRFGFLLLLSLSALIATLGLIMDSAPTIIGAMIIAPLMSPIVSLAFGLADFHLRTILVSAFTIALGTIAVVAISYSVASLIGSQIVGEQILARTSPSLIDLVVAIASGCTAAYAYARPSIASSIAGVAISVALVPPLAVAGIGLGIGLNTSNRSGWTLSELGLEQEGFDVALGAALLFLANLSGITLIATATFALQGYSSLRRTAFGFLAALLAVLVIFEPLGHSLRNFQAERLLISLIAEQQANQAISDFEVRRIWSWTFEGVTHIRVDALATEKYIENIQTNMDRIRDAISIKIGSDVKLIFDVLPVTVQEFTSSDRSSAH